MRKSALLLVLMLTACAPGSSYDSTGMLPDRNRTPGALNPSVGQENIHSTICVRGWTATIRPASQYTTDLKRKQLAEGYSYKGDTVLADYEEDHLVPLELGGSPADIKNLWPEPIQSAREKDQLENKLREMVCSGALTLSAAQNEIATDWTAAYSKYLGALRQ